MALRIEYEEEALADIADAARYGRRKFGDAAAERFLERVRELVSTVAAQPEMGRRVELETHPRLSEFQFFPLTTHPYLLFFRREDDALRVYGLVYASMDLPSVFRERDWGAK